MPIVDIELPYGADGRFTYTLSSERVLLHHVAPPAIDDLDACVRNCLNSPLDFPALWQAVLPDDRIVIALDDRVPAAPTLIRGCWDVLATRGIDPGSLLILQPAAGVGSTSGDPRSRLPDDVASQVRLARHDATEAQDRAYLASTTAGDRIYLAREIVDADFAFCLGEIAYDPLLGYRGTSSVLYPGLSSSEAVAKSRGQGHDELGPDDVRGLRQTIDEVGWLLGLQFTLQVVRAGRDRVAEVIAGGCEAVLRRGKQVLSECWEIEIDERPETVVVALDTPVPGEEWTALGAALETARRLVDRDGRIVVLSQLEGRPSTGVEMIRDSRTPRDALRPLRLDTPEDVTEATQLAKSLDWANVYLYSRLEDELVEDLFMIPLGAADESQRILESSDRLAFVEAAQYAHGSLRVAV